MKFALPASTAAALADGSAVLVRCPALGVDFILPTVHRRAPRELPAPRRVFVGLPAPAPSEEESDD